MVFGPASNILSGPTGQHKIILWFRFVAIRSMGPSSAFGQLLLGLLRFPVNRPMSSRKRRTSFLKSVYEASGLFLPDVYIVCGTGEAELEPRRPGVQASFLSCQTTMTTNWQIFCFTPCITASFLCLGLSPIPPPPLSVSRSGLCGD